MHVHVYTSITTNGKRVLIDSRHGPGIKQGHMMRNNGSCTNRLGLSSSLYQELTVQVGNGGKRWRVHEVVMKVGAVH